MPFLKKISLQRRIALLLGGLVVGVVGALFVITYRALEATEHEFKQSGLAVAETVGKEAVLPLLMQDEEGLQERLAKLAEGGLAIGGAFYDADGVLITEGGFADRLAVSAAGVYTLVDAEGDKVGYTRTADGGRVLLAAAPVTSQQGGAAERVGGIIVAFSAEPLAAQKRESLVFSLGALLAVLALAGLVTYQVRRTVVQPVQRLRRAAEAVEAGDLSARVVVDQQDEVGALAASFNAMVAASEDNLSALQEQTEQGERARAEAEALQQEADAARERLQHQVDQIAEVVAALTAGDLTRRLVIVDEGPVTVLMRQVNAMADELSAIIRAVRSGAEELSASAGTGRHSAEAIGGEAAQQAAHTADVAAAVEEMSTTLADSSRHAHEARETAQRAAALADTGESAFRATAEGMNRIAQIVTESAQRVTALGESSQEVGKIAETIDDIADQTNLLALNAAIEAARAGEQGRGFAVVADEVRKLAERTTVATQEIGAVIERIRQSTDEVVASMTHGSEEVARGLELAEDAGGALRQITDAVGNVTGTIEQMAAAGEQQTATSFEIASNVDAISSAAAAFSQATSDILNATEHVEARAAALRQRIERFTVEADAAHGDGAAFRSEVAAVSPRGRLVHGDGASVEGVF